MDPASQQALNDPILTDPDLSHQNEGNTALTGGIDHSLPLENTTPQAIRAAREEAIRLLGGNSKLRDLPEPAWMDNMDKLTDVLDEAARMVARSDCEHAVSYTALWAAKMPEEFPVYPRGATQEAAGSEKGTCRFRAVSFRTPVPLEETLAFYYSRALDAGYVVGYSANEAEHVLGGTHERSAFLIHARRDETGVTEIDLVTGSS